MESIAVTKPDMGALSRMRLPLSPFGVLAQEFSEELLARTGFEEGHWPFVPLDLLEEEEAVQLTEAAQPVVQVDLNLVLEALRQAGGSTERERTVERIVERIIHRREKETLRNTASERTILQPVIQTAGLLSPQQTVPATGQSALQWYVPVTRQPVLQQSVPVAGQLASQQSLQITDQSGPTRIPRDAEQGGRQETGRAPERSGRRESRSALQQNFYNTINQHIQFITNLRQGDTVQKKDRMIFRQAVPGGLGRSAMKFFRLLRDERVRVSSGSGVRSLSAGPTDWDLPQWEKRERSMRLNSRQAVRWAAPAEALSYLESGEDRGISGVRNMADGPAFREVERAIQQATQKLAAENSQVGQRRETVVWPFGRTRSERRAGRRQGQHNVENTASEDALHQLVFSEGIYTAQRLSEAGEDAGQTWERDLSVPAGATAAEDIHRMSPNARHAMQSPAAGRRQAGITAGLGDQLLTPAVRDIRTAGEIPAGAAAEHTEEPRLEGAAFQNKQTPGADSRLPMGTVQDIRIVDELPTDAAAQETEAEIAVYPDMPVLGAETAYRASPEWALPHAHGSAQMSAPGAELDHRTLPETETVPEPSRTASDTTTGQTGQQRRKNTRGSKQERPRSHRAMAEPGLPTVQEGSVQGQAAQKRRPETDHGAEGSVQTRQKTPSEAVTLTHASAEEVRQAQTEEKERIRSAPRANGTPVSAPTSGNERLASSVRDIRTAGEMPVGAAAEQATGPELSIRPDVPALGTETAWPDGDPIYGLPAETELAYRTTQEPESTARTASALRTGEARPGRTLAETAAYRQTAADTIVKPAASQGQEAGTGADTGSAMSYPAMEGFPMAAAKDIRVFNAAKAVSDTSTEQSPAAAEHISPSLPPVSIVYRGQDAAESPAAAERSQTGSQTAPLFRSLSTVSERIQTVLEQQRQDRQDSYTWLRERLSGQMHLMDRTPQNTAGNVILRQTVTGSSPGQFPRTATGMFTSQSRADTQRAMVPNSAKLAYGALEPGQDSASAAVQSQNQAVSRGTNTRRAMVPAPAELAYSIREPKQDAAGAAIQGQNQAVIRGMDTRRAMVPNSAKLAYSAREPGQDTASAAVQSQNQAVSRGTNTRRTMVPAPAELAYSTREPGQDAASAAVQGQNQAVIRGMDTRRTMVPDPAELAYSTREPGQDAASAAVQGLNQAVIRGMDTRRTMVPDPVELTYDVREQRRNAADAAVQGQSQIHGQKAADSDFIRSLPDWAMHFLQEGGSQTVTHTGRGMGTARDIAALALPEQEEAFEWTAPNYQPPAPVIFRERPQRQEPLQSQNIRISDAEIRRTADRVYQIIEDRIRRERRRLGL